MIKDNANIIIEEIREAAFEAGRRSNSVFLLPVIKRRTRQEIYELANCGFSTFGQNIAQELIESFDEKYGWHFVGQLQTNKVKDVVGRVGLIHSLDRLSLAAEINKCASQLSITQECLIQLNFSNDSKRGGLMLGKDSFSIINDFLEQIKVYKNIRVRGFMCVLPITKSDSEKEEYYKILQNIFESYKKSHGFNILSAGMSDDFRLAIKYGSTIVRIGRKFFE